MNDKLKPSERRLVSRKALVHGIANCMKCDWTCEDYNTVQRKAAHHARTTGHRVNVELGYAVTYYGSPWRVRDVNRNADTIGGSQLFIWAVAGGV